MFLRTSAAGAEGARIRMVATGAGVKGVISVIIFKSSDIERFSQCEVLK